jgi:pectate lyase
VGGSDRHASDDGRLRVTYRHNLWDGVEERAPRVRHGRVHVLGNVYRVPDAAGYGYSIGIGHRSRVLAEDNHWITPGLAPERLARLHGGTLFSDRGSVLDGRPVSLLQALRGTAAGRTLDDAIGWAPPYAAPHPPRGELLPWVLQQAGAGRLIR